jgi:hypothetical protein
MGAALTYARRYALFTLVGIAGEDDLDAPDLAGIKLNVGTSTTGAGGSELNRQGAASPAHPAASAPANRSHPRPLPRPSKRMLAVDASARLRDQLLAEMALLSAADEMIAWAHRTLPTKNTLGAEDASAIEKEFGDRMQALDGETRLPQPGEAPKTLSLDHSGTALEPGPPMSAAAKVRAPGDTPALTSEVPRRRKGRRSACGGDPVAEGIDKSVLTFAEPRRYRNKDHLRFVARQACLVCGRMPSDPHHLRFMQPRGLGLRVSDEFVAPLCRTHHREVHRVGDEAAWWKRADINPIKAARKLWESTRLNDGALRRPDGAAIKAPA